MSPMHRSAELRMHMSQFTVAELELVGLMLDLGAYEAIRADTDTHVGELVQRAIEESKSKHRAESDRSDHSNHCNCGNPLLLNTIHRQGGLNCVEVMLTPVFNGKNHVDNPSAQTSTEGFPSAGPAMSRLTGLG